jgi:hypothetical protein
MHDDALQRYTEAEHFGGPAAKYSPMTPHVQALFAQARGVSV